MMTITKCREVLDRYETTIADWHHWDARPETLLHLHTMLPRAMLDEIDRAHPRFIAVNLPEQVAEREKFMRWLGFLQGVLFAANVYTVDELRDHNRPRET